MNRTIMIIEPDADVRQRIRDSLTDKPCLFIELEDSSDAIMQLAVESPDLAIISAELPGCCGIDLTLEIRDFNPVIPIAVLLSKPTKEQIVIAKQVGAFDILLKPPDYKRLAENITRILWTQTDLLKRKAQKLTEVPGEEMTEEQIAQEENISEIEKMRRQILEESSGGEVKEAIPKGAEIININDAVPGMKIARTLYLKTIVYGDKGQILTAERIRQLTKIGVEEVCVYIDHNLKKIAENKKKAQAQSRAIITTEAEPVVASHTGPVAKKVFKKVERGAVRVAIEEETTIEVPPEAQTKKDKLTDDAEPLVSIMLEGMVIDISGGGCAVLSTEPLPQGKEVLMNFSLDDNKFPMQNIRGLVRYSRKKSDSKEFPYHNGIYFTNITERFRENLITVVFKIQRDQRQNRKLPR